MFGFKSRIKGGGNGLPKCVHFHVANCNLCQEGVYSALDAAPCPDLILLDLDLPGMSGHDVLRYCKQEARFKCIPVVVFASSEEPKEVRRAYAGGANACLRKPMEFPQLLSMLDHLNTFWFDLVILPPKG